MTVRGPLDREAARPILNVLVIARAAQQRSQREIAEVVGCRQNQINDWENGSTMPGFDWICRWAAALGYEVALLSTAPADNEDTTKLMDSGAAA